MLPPVTTEPIFEVPPRLQSIAARVVEETSTWDRLWRPFLYESIAWFVGAFLILAGTLYFVFESWAGMTSLSRSLVVFGMTAFYSVGFSAWGAFLARRAALRNAGRILGLIGSAVAPLAGLALGPMGGMLSLGEELQPRRRPARAPRAVAARLVRPRRRDGAPARRGARCRLPATHPGGRRRGHAHDGAGAARRAARSSRAVAERAALRALLPPLPAGPSGAPAGHRVRLRAGCAALPARAVLHPAAPGPRGGGGAPSCAGHLRPVHRLPARHVPGLP